MDEQKKRQVKPERVVKRGKTKLELVKQQLHNMIDSITEVDQVNIYHEHENVTDERTIPVICIDIRKGGRIQVFDKTDSEFYFHFG